LICVTVDSTKVILYDYLHLIILASLVLLSALWPVLLPFLLVPFSVNVVIHYWNKSNMFQVLPSIRQLNILIHVCRQLRTKDELFQNREVESSITALKSFQRKAFLLNMNNAEGIQGDLNIIGTYLMELIQAFLLLEVITLFRSLDELAGKSSAIITLFNYVGEIDTSISIASLRSGHMKTCRPLLQSSRKGLLAKNIYHPLVDGCVRNSLTIMNKGILITGSNMSGKSTFLRTLAINSVLAQTIHTCFADEYHSSIVKQFSSIRIDDDIFQGKSYYFQEVSIMGSMLKQADMEHQNLFILDEVFKGTNTVERIAAAKAILSYLNKNNNLVIVSTHDVELTDMLRQEYDLYHFTETVEDNKLQFDHTLKKGPLKTRNAIRILELSQYPDEVIREAKEISTNFPFDRHPSTG
jgi:DNA mismatch repair ATPase MutS